MKKKATFIEPLHSGHQKETVDNYRNGERTDRA